MKRIFIVAILMLMPFVASAKVIHLLPRPQQVTLSDGPAFALGRAVQLTDPTECSLLRNFLETHGSIVAAATAKVSVEIVSNLGTFDYTLAGFPNEGYKLAISENEVTIKARSNVGVIRAAQTLMQLAEGYDGTPSLEALTMTDYPAFKLRGWMQDVGRSFLSVDELKKEIDLLSRFKVNVFHWHLTENQAWRFEAKAYPQLTSAASMTRLAGKYYTQEQCREVEAYAAERGVIVIPEIDMPGHSEAFKRAMGFDMQTDQGVETLKNILAEVVETFPLAPYIHIGGDEVNITYPNFLQTLSGVVRANGKKVVTWNKLRNVAVSSAFADMTQMWATAGSKISGLPNIDCRYNYTNHFDVFADLVGIFKSNIYYEQKGNSDVAGFISAAWNDRNTPTETDIIKQNNIYANIIACTERAWIGGGKQYVEKGGVMLPNSGEEYDEFCDWERRFLFHKAGVLKDAEIPYVKQTNVRWRITEAFPNNGNAATRFPPETQETKEEYTYGGKTYGTKLVTGAGIYLRHTWGPSTIPAFYSNPQTNTTAYAYTYVYSPEAQTVGAQIEFYNYGRSEKDMAPDAGKWDRYGSNIWLNNTAIAPPTWDNSGVSGISSETLLKNENFTARTPIPVKLRKGWNKVLIKLPFNPDGRQRLQKWMFTFVLTDLEGRNAVEGLVYSPDKYLDESAQLVAATLSEMRSAVSESVGAEVGYYPESTAAEFTALLDEVEATLSDSLGNEARSKQIEALQNGLAAFQSKCSTSGINQPLASNDSVIYHYSLFTPLRDNRYLASQGAGSGLVGEAKSGSETQLWRFVRRTASAFDIVSVADGSYLSPSATNNTQMSTSATRPTRGWTIKAADEPGYVVVTSGNVQLNQTNSGLGYKIYNWGNGTNLTDSGCKYRVTLENTILTGIAQAQGPTSSAAEYFSLDGRRAAKPERGVYVVRENGVTQKKLFGHK